MKVLVACEESQAIEAGGGDGMTLRDCYDCFYSKLGGEKEPCKSCKSTDEGFTNWREVQPTNADRIRAMSGEEMEET